MARKNSAVESTISEKDANQIESRFECPICMHWLNEPVLTPCGHKFCKACITSWLTSNNKKSNPCCPIDNVKLMTEDLFPDNFTRREINDMSKPCPNAPHGCKITLSPVDTDAHLLQCVFRREHITSNPSAGVVTINCPFAKYGCSFQATDVNQQDAHSQEHMHKHLNMLLHAFVQSKSLDFKSIEATTLWDPPNKHGNKQTHQNGSANTSEQSDDARLKTTASAMSLLSDRDKYNESLMRALYERIVILEQLSQEQAVQMERLTSELNKINVANNNAYARYSGGILIWNITEFESKIRAMSANPNIMFYSPDVYTGPFGYRFCARINISPKALGSIGLHVHMKQSENDYHLDWPFRGCIKIWMIHENDKLTLHDKIMSNEKVKVFQRPQQEISPRGFGYIEYANVSDIRSGGFVSKNDTLTIKLHISIV